MSMIEYKGLWFDDTTPEILMDVVSECVKSRRIVHLLCGNPLTGVVTPSLKSVGYFSASTSPTRPVPLFNSFQYYTPTGERCSNPTESHAAWIKVDTILKMIDVDACSLLYQSYECQCAPLKVIQETRISPFEDVSTKAKIICANPQVEIAIPVDADYVNLCNFLFGRVHYLTEFGAPPTSDSLDQGIVNT